MGSRQVTKTGPTVTRGEVDGCSVNFFCGPSTLDRRAVSRDAADALLGLEGLHLLALDRLDADAEPLRWLLHLRIQTERPAVVAYRACGGLASDHGPRKHGLADAPCFGTPCR